MTGGVTNLMRWEWFKLRRRWMPWVLLAVLVAFSQLFIWGNFLSHRANRNANGEMVIGFESGERGVAVRVSCSDVLSGRPLNVPSEFSESDIARMRQTCLQIAEQQRARSHEATAGFTLPGSISSAIAIAQSIGLILIVILTASTIGTEYSWGTLRMALVRGTGRWQFLAAKLATMTLALVAALLLVLALTVVSSLIAGGLASGEVDSVASGRWMDAATALGKAWFALLPYIALAGLVTVLTTSTAAGMAISLGYYFAEQIASAILMNFFDWFQTIADYLLGRNMTAWMISASFESRGSPTVGLGIRIGDYPGGLHAFLVLVTYMLALGGLAFWLFHRRDVAGGGGG